MEKYEKPHVCTFVKEKFEKKYVQLWGLKKYIKCVYIKNMPDLHKLQNLKNILICFLFSLNKV